MYVVGYITQPWRSGPLYGGVLSSSAIHSPLITQGPADPRVSSALCLGTHSLAVSSWLSCFWCLPLAQMLVQAFRCGRSVPAHWWVKLGLGPLMGSAGSQREESRPWQRSWGRKPDKTQRHDLASGVPPEFSWTSTPQNQSLPALLLCFSLFWHSLEKSNSGLQAPASAQTPLMAL